MFTLLQSRFRRHQATLWYTASNVFLAAALFLGSFLCARLLDPSELGAFQTASLLVTYLGFLSLGVFNGFNRDYPYLLGKSEHAEANLVARTAYSFARTVASAATFIAVGQLGYFWFTKSDPALIWAAIAVIPVAGLTQISTVQLAMMTGRQAFTRIARIQTATAVMTLILLLLVWKFSVTGQAIRLALISVTTWSLYLVSTRESRSWHWDTRRIMQLIKRGLPIMAIGYFYQVFSVADRTLVAWVKGTEAVGHYALAGLAVAGIQSVYMPLAVATYSKANHAYGASHSVGTLIRPAKRFLILLSVSVLPLAAVVYFALPVFVPRFLPNYVEGIRAGQIACIASVAFCYCGTSFIFNVTGHNWIYGGMMAAAVGVFFLVGFGIPGAELQLEKVAWLRTGVTVALCLCSNAYLAFYMWSELRRESRAKNPPGEAKAGGHG